MSIFKYLAAAALEDVGSNPVLETTGLDEEKQDSQKSLSSVQLSEVSYGWTLLEH